MTPTDERTDEEQGPRINTTPIVASIYFMAVVTAILIARVFLTGG